MSRFFVFMLISIKCEKCNNEHRMSVPEKKQLLLRDNLERGGFSYSSSDLMVNNGKLEELYIYCKCGNYISLNFQ